AISRYTFSRIDDTFYKRAKQLDGDSFVIGGENYGQGSSREHAAIAPRYLGVRAVIAVSMARIHRRNLINFGIVPLLFQKAEDLARLNQGDSLALENFPGQLQLGREVDVRLADGKTLQVTHDMSEEEVATVLAGGLINQVKKQI
ncbi:MAG TPA: aconitate hydratase, partial [Microbulbifer sp.]